MYYLSVEAVELDEITRETVRGESEKRALHQLAFSRQEEKKPAEEGRGVLLVCLLNTIIDFFLCLSGR